MLKVIKDFWWQEIDLDMIKEWIRYMEESVLDRRAFMDEQIARWNATAVSPENRRGWILDRLKSATEDMAEYEEEAERARKCLADASERPWYVACSAISSASDLCDLIEKPSERRWSSREYAELLEQSVHKPTLVDGSAKTTAAMKRWWYFDGQFYAAAGDLV